MAQTRVSSPFRSVVIALALGGVGAWVLPSGQATASMFACGDPSNLCVISGGASWSANATATEADINGRNLKTRATINLNVEGGRGSLFVNGRYNGTAPLSGAQAPSGRNDIQVRDGTRVLAMGTLDIPPNAAVAILVNHR